MTTTSLSARVRPGSECAPWVWEEIRRLERELRAARDTNRLADDALQQAIGHLQAILNSQRTAMQALEADLAAREWLESIGSEPK